MIRLPDRISKQLPEGWFGLNTWFVGKIVGDEYFACAAFALDIYRVIVVVEEEEGLGQLSVGYADIIDSACRTPQDLFIRALDHVRDMGVFDEFQSDTKLGLALHRDEAKTFPIDDLIASEEHG